MPPSSSLDDMAQPYNDDDEYQAYKRSRRSQSPERLPLRRPPKSRVAAPSVPQRSRTPEIVDSTFEKDRRRRQQEEDRKSKVAEMLKAAAAAAEAAAAAPPAPKEEESSKKKSSKPKQTKEEKEALKEKRLMKLVGAVVVKCLSKYQKQMDHDAFKEHAKHVS